MCRKRGSQLSTSFSANLPGTLGDSMRDSLVEHFLSKICTFPVQWRWDQWPSNWHDSWRTGRGKNRSGCKILFCLVRQGNRRTRRQLKPRNIHPITLIRRVLKKVAQMRTPQTRKTREMIVHRTPISAVRPHPVRSVT